MATEAPSTGTKLHLIATISDDQQIDVRMWAVPTMPPKRDFVQLVTAMHLALASKTLPAIGLGPALDITQLVNDYGPGDDGHDS